MIAFIKKPICPGQTLTPNQLIQGLLIILFGNYPLPAFTLTPGAFMRQKPTKIRIFNTNKNLSTSPGFRFVTSLILLPELLLPLLCHYWAFVEPG